MFPTSHRRWTKLCEDMAKKKELPCTSEFGMMLRYVEHAPFSSKKSFEQGLLHFIWLLLAQASLRC
jgi:hypothetical protein